MGAVVHTYTHEARNLFQDRIFKVAFRRRTRSLAREIGTERTLDGNRNGNRLEMGETLSGSLFHVRKEENAKERK